MENIGEKLKNSYQLIHTGKIEEAKKVFEEMYNSFDKDKVA